MLNTLPITSPLPADFYNRSALLVARDLLGMTLVRVLPDGTRLAGKIVETEAYSGIDDLASHAGRHKRTPRNLPMWKAPGIAYVYRTYGMYWMLNVVAEPEDQPAAVLIRALEPLEGLDTMAANRPISKNPLHWTSGPARLALALAITGALNEASITDTAAGLWIAQGDPVPDAQIRTGSRIGLGKTPEPWLSIAWRWWIGGKFLRFGGFRQEGLRRVFFSQGDYNSRNP